MYLRNHSRLLTTKPCTERAMRSPYCCSHIWYCSTMQYVTQHTKCFRSQKPQSLEFGSWEIHGLRALNSGEYSLLGLRNTPLMIKCNDHQHTKTILATVIILNTSPSTARFRDQHGLFIKQSLLVCLMKEHSCSRNIALVGDGFWIMHFPEKGVHVRDLLEMVLPGIWLLLPVPGSVPPTHSSKIQKVPVSV